MIEDFSVVDGDAINSADLLVGFNPTTDAISDFVSFSNSGSDSQMFVDRDGTAGTYSSAQMALVKGVTDLDAETLETSSNLIAA